MLRVYPPTFGPTDEISTGAIGSLSFVVNDEVRQKINGDWCLTFSYPVAMEGAELVTADHLVLAEGQLYRIRRVRTVDTAGKQILEVEAPHVAFDLQNYCIENIETSETDLDGISAQAAMIQVLAGTPFSVGTVDVGDHKDYLDILQMNVMDSLKQIVSLWGGELYFDNFTVHLRAQCGLDRHYPIRQGKNITSLKYTEDLAETVTRLHIIGYGGADIKPVNDGKDYIDSRYIGNYSHVLEGYVTFDDEDMPDVLLEMGREHLKKVEVPKISFDLSLANLKGSPQYAHYAALETYELGDTAILHHDALKTDFVLRCQERVFIASTGVNKSVKLGNAEEDLADAISSAMDAASAIHAVTGKHHTLRADRLQGIIDAMKTVLFASADYQTAQVYKDRGVLFENNHQESASYGAMYIGPGMFAIANQKDAAGEWDWRTFGNGSGFSADEITTGTLNAARVDVANLDLSVNQIFSVAMGEVNSRLEDTEGNVTELSQTVDGFDQRIENAEGAVAQASASVDGLSVSLSDTDGRVAALQALVNEINLALADENGRSTALQATVEGLLLLFKDQENLNAYLRVTENGLEIGREGDPAKFRADNRTLEVTNLKTERVSITQSMSQDAEWAWIATKSGLGLKYIG